MASPKVAWRMEETAPEPVQTAVGETALRLTDVVLDYPLGPLTRASLKSHLFSLFGGGSEHKNKPALEYVRALDGVSFELRDGDRLGVIGRNGAGKSTLLRALAGVYPLAAGRIEVQGQVQGMFDIGLGFEVEATGRENILYRGLVMGMSPAQIRAREAEIVAFADIGEFIDLPVRTYSSGMAVRLAFAISTYIQGDILLLDEMLGAGDAAFQTKAQVRMRNVVSSANILVLVSHDMDLIQEICTRAIWLEKGKVVADGPAKDVVAQYRAVTVG